MITYDTAEYYLWLLEKAIKDFENHLKGNPYPHLVDDGLAIMKTTLACIEKLFTEEEQ